MAVAECESIMGVWERSLQWDPWAETLVGVRTKS